LFVLTLNNKVIYEYNGNTRLPGHKRRYLDGMDDDMDQGIKIDDVLVVNPDAVQRLDYVVFNLIQGLDEDNQGLIQLTSDYIANRYSDKSVIKIVQGEDKKMISITYE